MKAISLSKVQRLTQLALVMALLAPAAHAQDEGWYVGLGVGQSDADITNDRIGDTLIGNGFTPGTINGDDQDTAAKLFGGYNFNRYLGVEASYFDLGNFGFTTSLTPLSTFGGEARLKGAALDLVGKMPFTDKLNGFVRAGAHDMRIRESFANSPAAAYFDNASDNDTDAHYGLGLQYAFTDRLSVRAEYERFELSDRRLIDDQVDLATIGIVYNFGSRPAPVAAPAPAPTPAPAPAPAPAPVPQPTRVTLSADALFDFDEAELRNAGRQELDVLVEGLRGMTYEVLIVTGHTDRIGTNAYNQALSQRRAETVRTYLISSGIPANDIRSSGVGPTQPITTPGQCQNMARDALIACLQPDRRVEVEVSGTRNP